MTRPLRQGLLKSGATISCISSQIHFECTGEALEIIVLESASGHEMLVDGIGRVGPFMDEAHTGYLSLPGS